MATVSSGRVIQDHSCQVPSCEQLTDDVLYPFCIIKHIRIVYAAEMSEGHSRAST
ncbi:MAG: hypothetical protein H6750_02775 [Nitrospiraceae bacterium]|nr:hypothetical protein [Nitrospira sp.]MCB9773236.1 hypothetical protein [Nitrospiraceae bacterium]